MQTIDKFNFAGKKAFVRVDFNVPLDENFNITDDTRMRAALPTLKKILADGGSIIIGSHLGLSLIHISEPTRRTPISYAVFCLKKKKSSA